MGEPSPKALEKIRRRATSLFSPLHLVLAAAGAAAGVACLAAGSVLAGAGIAWRLPLGIVHYALVGAAGSLLLHHGFARARETGGAWKTVLLGALVGTGSGVLWSLLLGTVSALSGEDPASDVSLVLMVLPLAGALLALWIRHPGASPGLIHSLLKGVACTWLSLVLLCLVLFGAVGHTVGGEGRNASLFWVWEELSLTFLVTRLMIATTATALLPPMLAVAAWLWFRDRRKDRGAALPSGRASAGPMPGPSRGAGLLHPVAGWCGRSG